MAYGEGLEGEAAMAKGLGVSIDELQATFDKALDKRFGALRAALRTPSSRRSERRRAPGDECRRL